MDSEGIDYFENLCLEADSSCEDQRGFSTPRIGVPDQKIALHVNVHFYTDKELMANSPAACQRACEIEAEFLCRSYLYLGPPNGAQYNCRLYHLDHWTLPDGPSTFLLNDRPLIDNGGRIGTFYENRCKRSLPGDFDTTINPGGSFTGSNGITDGIGATGDLGFPSLGDDLSNVGLGVGGGAAGGGAGGVGANGGAGGSGITDNAIDTGEDNVNCDYLGTCYDVSVHCKDTRIVVNVGTNKPFSGRIYALGRSETCNVDVINSDTFRLDLTMAGQDCNTQSAGGVYTNTVVVQRHSVVMTKTDKIYKVRCTYDTSSKNITFGMMPIRDPDMISITSAPEAPAPRIRILDSRTKEVETVRIGDRLTFRIEIPEKTPYGIFARNCVAMAKDSRSTFPIIDENGCPVDPTIFPRFTPEGTALQSVYEAFRFTESYGVIFQCNVKYCLGPCEPAVCTYGRENFESWGRKKRDLSKRAVENSVDTAMSLSREIIVLDFGDEATNPYDFDKPTTPAGGNLTDFKVDAVNWPGTSEEIFSSVTETDTCPTRTSVLALSVVCALLLVIYTDTCPTRTSVL